MTIHKIINIFYQKYQAATHFSVTTYRYSCFILSSKLRSWSVEDIWKTTDNISLNFEILAAKTFKIVFLLAWVYFIVYLAYIINQLDTFSKWIFNYLATRIFIINKSHFCLRAAVRSAIVPCAVYIINTTPYLPMHFVIWILLFYILTTIIFLYMNTKN